MTTEKVFNDSHFPRPTYNPSDYYETYTSFQYILKCMACNAEHLVNLKTKIRKPASENDPLIHLYFFS